eukprot:1439109-Pyramimonas_sp.AAC.1
MIRVKLHGRASGLKRTNGACMKKPWSIAINSVVLADRIIRCRDGSHRHVEARGRDSKIAEDYTS